MLAPQKHTSPCLFVVKVTSEADLGFMERKGLVGLCSL